MHLKEGKKTNCATAAREGSEQESSADPKVNVEEKERGAGAEISLQPTEKMMERQLSPCSPCRSMVEQPVEDSTPEQGDAQRRLLPAGSLRWRRLLAGSCGPMEKSPY